MTLMPEDRKKQQEAMKSVSLNSLVARPPVGSRNLGEVEFLGQGRGTRSPDGGFDDSLPSETPCQADDAFDWCRRI
jgi:hypothetical protein